MVKSFSSHIAHVNMRKSAPPMFIQRPVAIISVKMPGIYNLYLSAATGNELFKSENVTDRACTVKWFCFLLNELHTTAKHLSLRKVFKTGIWNLISTKKLYWKMSVYYCVRWRQMITLSLVPVAIEDKDLNRAFLLHRSFLKSCFPLFDRLWYYRQK